MARKFEKVSLSQYAKDILDVKEVPETIESWIGDRYSNIKIPVRSTQKSAGYDFFAPNGFVLDPGQTIKIATGIKAQMADDNFLALFPRSGLGFKYRVRLDNTVGIVDADYYNNPGNEGHIFIKITNEGDKELMVKEGEAFAQGIFLPFLLTDDDSSDGVREGGIGSTSK
jgi:dUTP pyrophosphatase